MAMQLDGNVALVTGSAKRIGRSIALGLARAGADVMVHYNRSEADARRTADEIKTLGRRAGLVQGELADARTPSKLVDETVGQLGRLDILINNASIFEPMPLEGLELGAWDRMLRINLTAPALLARAAWEQFKAHGAGKIVNLTDIIAERPWHEYIAYSISKAGLVALTKALARAMAPTVQVNAVSPGVSLWPEDFTDQQKAAILTRVPMGRAADPDEVAAAVLFLVTGSSYITGEVLNADGGRSVV